MLVTDTVPDVSIADVAVDRLVRRCRRRHAPVAPPRPPPHPPRPRRSDRHGGDRPHRVLILWQFWIEPSISDTSVPLFVRSVWASYPILDAILLAVVLRTLVELRTESDDGDVPRRRRRLLADLRLHVPDRRSGGLRRRPARRRVDGRRRPAGRRVLASSGPRRRRRAESRDRAPPAGRAGGSRVGDRAAPRARVHRVGRVRPGPRRQPGAAPRGDVRVRRARRRPGDATPQAPRPRPGRPGLERAAVPRPRRELVRRRARPRRRRLGHERRAEPRHVARLSRRADPWLSRARLPVGRPTSTPGRCSTRPCSRPAWCCRARRAPPVPTAPTCGCRRERSTCSTSPTSGASSSTCTTSPTASWPRKSSPTRPSTTR